VGSQEWAGELSFIPRTLSFAKQSNITIKATLACSSIDQILHLPRSSQAYIQLGPSLESFDSLNLKEEADVWTYILASPIFSSYKAYKWLTGSAFVDQAFKWLWKNSLANTSISTSFCFS
jgi:hypothetical protein